MRTAIKEEEVFKFDELTEEGKEMAINELFDINVDYDWWTFVYEDAANIGLKITAFDIDRGSYVKGNFTEDPVTVANKIMVEHGEKTETYKTAKDFLDSLPVEPEDDSDEYYDWEQEVEELGEEFERSLKEDYRIMLSREYDYLTSKTAIIETIKANEYEFTERGRK